MANLGPSLGLTHTVKQNDTQPPCRVLLQNEDGSPASLNPGDTVKFRMSPQVIGLRASIFANATINDLASGDVQYDFLVDDTADPGVYNAEFVVNRVGGAVQTFPSEGYITVVVQAIAA